MFRGKTGVGGLKSHPLTHDGMAPPCDRCRNTSPTPHTCRRTAVTSIIHSRRRRTAPLRVLFMPRKHTTTPTLAAIVVPPLNTPTLVAENPASFRISGDQGSSTACHPVRSSRKALTSQPPFTPFPVPSPVPRPVPMIVMRFILPHLRPLQPVNHVV